MSIEMVVLPPDRQPVLRVRPEPNDANATGDIFGGWLMSHIDVAGVIAASPRAGGHVVTVAVKDLRFIQPLFVYDLVTFYADVISVGRTSLTVKVEVYAQRLGHYTEKAIKVSDATLIYVAVHKPGEPREIPPL